MCTGKREIELPRFTRSYKSVIFDLTNDIFVLVVDSLSGRRPEHLGKN